MYSVGEARPIESLGFCECVHATDFTAGRVLISSELEWEWD